MITVLTIDWCTPNCCHSPPLNLIYHQSTTRPRLQGHEHFKPSCRLCPWSNWNVALKTQSPLHGGQYSRACSLLLSPHTPNSLCWDCTILTRLGYVANAAFSLAGFMLHEQNESVTLPRQTSSVKQNCVTSPRQWGLHCLNETPLLRRGSLLLRAFLTCFLIVYLKLNH